MAISSLEIIGWGVKLCDHKNRTPDDCSNINDSIYFVSSNWLPKIAEKSTGSPLVLNHSTFIIGHIQHCEYIVNKGLYISAIINDHDFLSFIYNSFLNYTQKKKNEYLFNRLD